MNANIVDADLRPTEHRFRNIDRAELRRHHTAIQDGLRHLMTKKDYRKYQTATTANTKHAALVDGLTASLERKRAVGREALYGKADKATAPEPARPAPISKPKTANKKSARKASAKKKHAA